MMFSGSRKFVLIGLFTLVLIGGVNLVWWVNYNRTSTLLEEQLAHRLSLVAAHGRGNISPEQIAGLIDGEFESFVELTETLEKLRASDSLAEVFLLDEDYRYLATTLLEPDSIYFMSDLNGVLIDSINYGITDRILLSPTYQSGEMFLKAAFTGIYDESGRVVAVLGAETSVDYFDALVDLKENLYLATAISLGGGLLAGLILVILQVRINRVERQAFLNQTQSFLGRMVAVVAHEIRNPLAIIRGSAERIKKRDQAEEAGFIIEETDRLGQIVTGYLEFAKGRKSILAAEKRDNFSLTQLVRDVQVRLATELAPEPVSWTESGNAINIELNGYRHSVRQVLYNLALNGAQACQERGRPIELGISLRDNESTVELAISDKGGGMPPRQLKKVFTPFYTTKQRGSGLGLYLSRSIIEEMDGSLTASSENDGLVVRVTLPR